MRAICSRRFFLVNSLCWASAVARAIAARAALWAASRCRSNDVASSCASPAARWRAPSPATVSASRSWASRTELMASTSLSLASTLSLLLATSRLAALMAASAVALMPAVSCSNTDPRSTSNPLSRTAFRFSCRPIWILRALFRRSLSAALSSSLIPLTASTVASFRARWAATTAALSPSPEATADLAASRVSVARLTDSACPAVFRDAPLILSWRSSSILRSSAVMVPAFSFASAASFDAAATRSMPSTVASKVVSSVADARSSSWTAAVAAI